MDPKLFNENNTEHLSEAKQKLFNLEQTGSYVFHGSGEDIEELEPRQAHNYVDLKKIPDGDPSVFASSKAEYAIFMAIINSKNCPKGRRSLVGVWSGKLKFKVTEDTLLQLDESASGWVYIFDKNYFSQRQEGGVQYISLEKVKPIEKIKVTKEDLPDKIEIIEEKGF
jgi:hypothetical protein